jgi:hypothetical protein
LGALTFPRGIALTLLIFALFRVGAPRKFIRGLLSELELLRILGFALGARLTLDLLLLGELLRILGTLFFFFFSFEFLGFALTEEMRG